ncbi:MAG: acid phosphatase type 7 [Solirubrobacteraceae bacterium]|jgi:hypothetical protein|nr:acid phosphatase type 7 [Solirubrobacteraceae bacterium]
MSALALAWLTVAAAPAGAVERRSRPPACPRSAYQVGAGAFYALQPVRYARRGRMLKARFSFLDRARETKHLTRVYRVRHGEVRITAVREGRPGDGKVTTYRQSCAPGAQRAAKAKRGVFRDTVPLPLAFVWKLPGNHRAPAPPSDGDSTSPNPPARSSWTLLTAGDVADCFNNVHGDPSSGQHPGPGAILTADLIRTLLPVDDLLALGDLAYESGSAAEFAACYDPTWGAFKAFTHPAPGNHDYRSPGAAPYFAYWGAQAGPPGRGYYSYEVGPWHIVSLNTEDDIGANGGQAAWLRADLAAHPAVCTMAFWHRPRFSNDLLHGNAPDLAPLYAILYDAGVDVLLEGHAHVYERWAELGPNGDAQPGRGIRNLVVGTGGAASTPPGTSLAPGEETQQGNVFGVLQIRLTATGYTLHFIPAAGSSYSDASSGTCH